MILMTLFTIGFNKKGLEQDNLIKEQIYNADETGLFLKALPYKTPADLSENTATGYKVSKERITLMAFANAGGIHKLMLVCIGKSKNPRSFKGSNMKLFPVDYYNNDANKF